MKLSSIILLGVVLVVAVSQVDARNTSKRGGGGKDMDLGEMATRLCVEKKCVTTLEKVLCNGKSLSMKNIPECVKYVSANFGSLFASYASVTNDCSPSIKKCMTALPGNLMGMFMGGIK